MPSGVMDIIIKSALRKSILSVVLVTTCLYSTNNAYPEDSAALLRRVEQLEAELQELKSALGKVAPAHTSDLKAPAVSQKSPEQIDESLFRPQSQGQMQGGIQSAVGSQTAQAQPDAAATVAKSELDKRIQELGQFGITYRSDGFKVDAMRFGAYGESIFGGIDNGNGWNNGFDANRVVLLGTYQLSDDIIFNTEIEFEHGGIAFDEDDKLGGAVEVEQMFVDFRVNDHLSWRSFGVDVVPLGYINLFHEPTQFYSSNRPELYDGLIPSTWYAASTGAYGKIVDGLNYQFQVSAGMEDAGTTASESGGSVPDGGYEGGISGTEALGLARAPIGDRSQLSDNLAYTLRFSYAPYFIPGLSGSTSFYYTDSTTPRGAYGTNANGSTRLLGQSNLAIFDTEVRYRLPATGLELRGEFVHAGFGDTDNLRANNDTDPTNNVGSSMYGYSFEGAYHFQLTKNQMQPWELVPFYRFSQIDLQTSGVHGSDINAPTGQGFKTFHTVGAALFPTRKVVIKADYQFKLDRDSETANERSFLGSLGFFF